MTYCPASLIDELKCYEAAAEEAFSDGGQFVEDYHPYGSTTARESRFEAPDTIEIETLDDILPLSFYMHELTYRLTAINGDIATYTYS